MAHTSVNKMEGIMSLWDWFPLEEEIPEFQNSKTVLLEPE